jgi:hypothetical protein
VKHWLSSAFCLWLSLSIVHASERWTEARANEWYRRQPWLTGANYVPANAINALEMWQQATFDPVQIDRELGLAESIGMNTMRVFLHDLLWQQDEVGFKERMAKFLAIAEKHRIRPIFVLFDSCWDPNPRLGPQHSPTPGVHNSGWVQAPGAQALRDSVHYERLKDYVKGVMSAFARDRRVLAWDLWNEPDNTNDASYGTLEPTDKLVLVQALLPQVFQWARETNPIQPLTSGVWHDVPSATKLLSPIMRIQIENSDIVSFHDYAKPHEFEKQIRSLKKFRRPIICTEYLARGIGSTFEGILPVAKRYRVAAINWGLVEGKMQTFLPWDSWQRPYVDRQPEVWFHDIFRSDGTPYSDQEAELFRKLTGKSSR